MIFIEKIDDVFRKSKNIYVVTICSKARSSMYYARITHEGFSAKAVVKDGKGQRFYGVSKWDGIGNYDEEFGDKLAILRAVMLKEKDRKKKINNAIQEKKKKIKWLMDDIKKLEMDNNGLTDVEEMYKCYLALWG